MAKTSEFLAEASLTAAPSSSSRFHANPFASAAFIHEGELPAGDRGVTPWRASPSAITNTLSTPEIAFTGDTTSDFILDPDNADVLAAKILIVEIAGHSDQLGNKAILLTHFSGRYTSEVG
ncbi:hypothetical protein HU200_047002 [Digitaria exilis]|uniref:Uncharacterized protein n=1 Tax=Digitaria exilis TaxID=1010633 RepID=A0A835B8Z7_9POAL|nr:hypothetical protein HU200_047002 [Digitaria exilis]